MQKRVIEREMEVWQIVEEQKQAELFAQGARGDDGDGESVAASLREEIDMGEAKGLQRGSVGSDRGG
jgi:indoleamine 2,3-dioxygenase